MEITQAGDILFVYDPNTMSYLGCINLVKYQTNELTKCNSIIPLQNKSHNKAPFLKMDGGIFMQ
jgi:hypothetical protein